MNADSVALARYLYSNPEARTRLAVEAMKTGAESNNIYLKRLQQLKASGSDSVTLETVKKNFRASMENITEANATLNNFGPLGWKSSNAPVTAYTVISKITGLLATVLAIFMGAPFWFDLLNKIANLRGRGPKPASSTSNDNNKD